MSSVRDELERYLTRNGFTVASYDAATVEIPVGPITLSLPNTKGRQAVVRWHDLHHLATGYGTDLTGEAEIGAWELRAGCTTLAAYVYNAMAVALGLLVSPVRTLRAFSDAAGQTTLYRLDMTYDEALSLDLATLRERMRVPANGVAREPAGLHSAAPRVSRELSA